ncbi:Signal transduction histidine kinase [Bacillus sp. OV322]|uniref:sensor histidine kinase n=1 Tax=Bacillus sp. OV322 TaxID=1882764 RepID=UPI0008E38279|nr:HAMP domain-containing sensor histidine kinase [Bacillus sp. OV322]SFC88194.1 Signal transduction histidine kinase [Bacillus sp. OV322]
MKNRMILLLQKLRVNYIYQMLGSHISVLLVAFIVLSLLFANYVERLVYQNKTDELITYGRSILDKFEKNPQGPVATLEQFYTVLNARNINFSIFDENQNIVYPFTGRLSKFVPTRDEWKQISEGKTVVIKRESQRFGQEVSMVVLPYIRNGSLLGGILLISPISGSAEMISEINHYLLYTVLIALAISFLFSWVLSKIHVSRIKRIREATSMISSGKYDVHVPSSALDEIGDLGNDFNKMAERLKASYEEIEVLENRRRQFMADVSHELRTPLATIRGMIEGLQDGIIPEEDRENGIKLASKETKRLIRLVNENLDYEKIRSNQIKLNKEHIELFEMLEIIKEQLLFQAEEKNNVLIAEADSNAKVYADYDRLTQILINITKNSIQFTENGTIWLRGKSEMKQTVIEIEDTGKGIDPKEIESIWRRFYKADLSRSSTPYGEFGLGLSIVKQLVQLHNGEIDVTSEKGKGTKFVIRLPVQSE